VALRVRWAEISVETTATEQRARVEQREHLARVSSFTLATLIDISNSLAHLAQYGTAAINGETVPQLTRVGPATMPVDCEWDGDDSEVDTDME
jgi:hypothetical protein